MKVVIEADGGSRGNPGPAGFGALVRTTDGDVLVESAAGIGTATNNVAEYRGLIAGLQACLQLQPTAIEVRMDSKLVVEQMAGRWQVKHPSMKPLAAEAAALVRRLAVPVAWTWVPRAANAHADRLANEAMDASARGEIWQTPMPGQPPAPATGAVGVQAPAEVPPARLSGWMSAPAAPTTTLLLRHGQTPLSVEKRFSGLGEAALTEVGEGQAAAAADRLARQHREITAVVSSPLRRARRTAELAGAALGLPVVEEDDLRETDFGSWEGLTFGQVRQRWPQDMAAWLADPLVAPPGGESFGQTEIRVRGVLTRVREDYPGQTVLLVTHVTPLKTLVRIALDAPPSALYRLHVDLCSLSTVDWFADGPSVLRRFNDTAHLSG